MNEDLLKKVVSLAQLDRDAMGVYDDALKHTASDEDVDSHFKEFRDEHENHVAELSAAIVRLGGTAPELGVDAMGRVAEWVTALRSMGGPNGALHALRTAEKYHNSRYEEAATWDVDDADLKATLARFLAEEKRHLAFIEGRLGKEPEAAE
jgi:rubrerythrin